MNVTVNGEDRSFSEGATLQALLVEMGMSANKGIAVAVNQSVVPTRQWAECQLSEGDAVLVIQATQGG
ncbi:MAG: sulfur carrier protein ThiS [Coraliomargaritaceae bacterium]